MNLIIDALAVIAVFSAVHERVLEALRGLASPSPKKDGLLDRLTAGGLSWVPAVALALATQANLFALLTGGTAEFFGGYLHGFRWPSSLDMLWELVRTLIGCVLMGLTTTLGSRFWHDLVKALMDLRTGLKSLPEATRRLAAPEVSKALDAAALELENHGDDALKRVAKAIQAAASTTARERPSHEAVTTQLISNALVQAADLLSPAGTPGAQEPVAKALLKAAVKVQRGT